MKVTYKTLEHKFRCAELTVSQYKDLLKSIFGEEVILEEFLENFLEMFSSISGKPIEFFYNLSWYEMFSLLIQLRIYTLGETCQIVITDNSGDASSPSKFTVQLNLVQMNQDLLMELETYFPQTLSSNNIEVVLFPPTLQKDFEPLSENNHFKYLFSCTVLNKTIKQTLKTTSSTLIQDVLKRLPVSLSSQITECVDKSISALSNLNFLEGYDKCENTALFFVPTQEKFLWFCKLFFAESLNVFYSNLFYLSKIGSMDLNYLETCTPGELLFFVNKLQEYLKQQESDQFDDPSHDNLKESMNGL